MDQIFGSIKRKMSKRTPTQQATETSKSPTNDGYLAPSNSNPFTSGTPATRRPSGSGLNPFARQSASNDPPPAYTAYTAYTPGPAYPAPVSSAAPTSEDTDTDQYAFLKKFDTVFLIDDSSSMRAETPRRWDQVQGALQAIAPICAERDADGVDVWFLNNPKVWKNIRTSSHVLEIFQDAHPNGGTLTGTRLYDMLDPYLAKYDKDRKGTKPINIIVITDGAAQDDVESTIEYVAGKLDAWSAPPWQVGIQFFQVGTDERAREYLKKLDDSISKDKGLRDIVDTVPFVSKTGGQLTADGIMKVVLGSVNRRLDRNSTDLHRG